MTRLVLLFVAVLGASAAKPRYGPYPIFWNVGSSPPATFNVSKWGFIPGHETQTGNECSIPGCTPWTQGAFPLLSPEGKVLRNGGLPQLMNLTLHLSLIEEQLPQWIPSNDWTGNAVFDFESFTTVWEENQSSDSWHSKAYQTASIALVKKAHPTWNSSQVLAAAKSEFEAAATNLFVQTLNTAKRIRPNAKWGFYGLPLNIAQPCDTVNGTVVCGYDLPNFIGRLFRSYSEDAQRPVWEASTALYPSIYVTEFMAPEYLDAYIRNTVRETVRCSKLAGDIPVYPFIWHMYHDDSNIISDSTLNSSLLVPYEEAANGIVVWGPGKQTSNQTYETWFKTDGGPANLKVETMINQCSEAHCSGNGVCTSLEASSSTTCRCFNGFSGVSCSTHKPLN